jgi:hypothetical protein
VTTTLAGISGSVVCSLTNPKKKRTGSFDTTSLVEARLRLVRNAFVSRALSQRRLLSFKSGHELRS